MMETNVRIWEMVARATDGAQDLAREIEERDEVIEAQRARIAELENEFERWKTSFRDVQIEEMGYTMREVAALGIDFDKEIVSDGNALHDVVMARISVLRDSEKQLAAMTAERDRLLKIVQEAL
jgi:hypothetical protein